MQVAQALKLVMILLLQSIPQRMMDGRLKKRVDLKPVSHIVLEEETDLARNAGMKSLGMIYMREGET